jgi:signal transduction histidine kinase
VFRVLRIAFVYLVAVIAGGALALLATYYAAADNVYVLFAVLLVVASALIAGTGPAVVVAITVVVGDDLILSGRLPPIEQWRDEVIFATVAIAVGLLVSAKRKQQLQAQRLAARERALRTERDAILAAISHDVRNPLAVIIGSARRAIVEGAPSNFDRLFRRIDSAAVQASSMIDELVDLRSIDGNEMELDLQRRDLRRTLDAALDQMEGVVRGHTLRYHVPDAPVVALYDERRLQRVFQNLLGNAIKYSPQGGDIEVGVEAAGGLARVTVRDHGIGIPPDEHSLIFERGYRARGSAGIPGSGLGLFISAEIVKRHAGTLSCASAPGSGTLFELTLPLVGGPPAELSQQPLRDRSGTSVANAAIADRHNRDQFPRGAGEKRLVRAE